jgi:hypothetical protein
MMGGFPFALIHRRGEYACGGVAFYLQEMPRIGDLLYSTSAQFPDGSMPISGEKVHCGSCGNPIPEPLMTEDVEAHD